jgi:hypothetical protein
MTKIDIGVVEHFVRTALQREVLAIYRERRDIAGNFDIDLIVEEEWALQTAKSLTRGCVKDPKWTREAAIAVMQNLRVPFDEIDQVLIRVFGQ